MEESEIGMEDGLESDEHDSYEWDEEEYGASYNDSLVYEDDGMFDAEGNEVDLDLLGDGFDGNMEAYNDWMLNSH